MRCVHALGALRSLFVQSHRMVVAGVVAASAVTFVAQSATAGMMRDANGWTNFTPSGDSRVIYVSSTGNDSNSGLSASSPVKTIAKAKTLMRDLKPDWMLLKRGDTWNESLGDWRRRGRSSTEPMLIGAYGSGARPLLKTGTSNGITVWNSTTNTYSNIAINGIHLQSTGNTGTNVPTGIRWDRPGENLLIEDVKIEGYKDNVSINAVTGRMKNVQIRRSVIADAFSNKSTSHAQGVYTSKVDGLVIEENVIDHNGWNSKVSGAVPTTYNHNLYVQSDNTGLTVRGNIISGASSHGLQARPGGTVEKNLFLDNSIAFFIAGKGGVASDNVVLHGSRRLLSPDNQPRGWGIDMFNIAGSDAVRNILAHTPSGANPLAGMSGVDNIGNVIYQWGKTTSGSALDPSRTIASYDSYASGGTGSLERFIAAARNLSRYSWDSDYSAYSAINYFQQGFFGKPMVQSLMVVPEPAALSLLAFAGLLLRRSRRN